MLICEGVVPSPAMCENGGAVCMPPRGEKHRFQSLLYIPYSTRRNLLRRRFVICRGITQTVRTTNAVSEQEIHIGDSTHPHDQSIFPMSLSVINTIVSKPANPIPPLEF